MAGFIDGDEGIAFIAGTDFGCIDGICITGFGDAMTGVGFAWGNTSIMGVLWGIGFASMRIGSAFMTGFGSTLWGISEVADPIIASLISIAAQPASIRAPLIASSATPTFR
jgi:hypothetical protein